MGRRLSGRLPVAVVAAWFLTSGAPAFSHAVIAGNEAPAGSSYRLVIAIAHGCEGSPTLRVRVRMPEGIFGVKPQPKPGWELTTRKETLPQPTKGPHGNAITEAVVEVTWSGKLADEHFDEFVLQMMLPDKAGRTIYFPTVQECEHGVHRWIEIPSAAKPAKDLKEPAPSLRLTPKRHAH